MNNLELQALRYLFFLSVKESATWISGDSDTEKWSQWESGEKEIPEDIIVKMEALRLIRKERIAAIVHKINDRIGNNTMRYFTSFEDFLQVYPSGDFLQWKLYQSAAAELFSRNLERLC